MDLNDTPCTPQDQVFPQGARNPQMAAGARRCREEDQDSVTRHSAHSDHLEATQVDADVKEWRELAHKYRMESDALIPVDDFHGEADRDASAAVASRFNTVLDKAHEVKAALQQLSQIRLLATAPNGATIYSAKAEYRPKLQVMSATLQQAADKIRVLRHAGNMILLFVHRVLGYPEDPLQLVKKTDLPQRADAKTPITPVHKFMLTEEKIKQFLALADHYKNQVKVALDYSRPILRRTNTQFAMFVSQHPDWMDKYAAEPSGEDDDDDDDEDDDDEEEDDEGSQDATD